VNYEFLYFTTIGTPAGNYFSLFAQSKVAKESAAKTYNPTITGTLFLWCSTGKEKATQKESRIKTGSF
jgi:hypothetical protein